MSERNKDFCSSCDCTWDVEGPNPIDWPHCKITELQSQLSIAEGYKVEADRECERLRAEVGRLARACADGWGEPTLINTLRERAETAEAAIKAERERCRLLASGMGFMALAQEIARGET